MSMVSSKKKFKHGFETITAAFQFQSNISAEYESKKWYNVTLFYCLEKKKAILKESVVV